VQTAYQEEPHAGEEHVEQHNSNRTSKRLAVALLTMGVLSLLAGHAPLAYAEPAVTAEQTDKALDENRRVCRRLPVTGTHFKRRICKTAAAWQAEEEAAREYAQKLERGQDVEQVHIQRQGSL
jgi:hypothetical protein